MKRLFVRDVGHFDKLTLFITPFPHPNRFSVLYPTCNNLLPHIMELRRLADGWTSLLARVRPWFWRSGNEIPLGVCCTWDPFCRNLSNDIICEIIAVRANIGFLTPSYLPPCRTLATSHPSKSPQFSSHLSQFCALLNRWSSLEYCA
jgi:hypothetical protein